MPNEHQIMSELGDVKNVLGNVEGTLEALNEKVLELNGRSVRALEKLAVHEERFISVMKELGRLEDKRHGVKETSEKLVTIRDLRVVSIVVGGIWAVVQGGVWIVQHIKLLM
jgi:chromosome segregation ATPase